jgi:hypothetical protein
MSSETSTKYLTSQDLNVLQRVLRNAGYTEDMLFDRPRPFNVAAKLLVRLFQAGMTDPADLTVQLERHFGKPPKKETAPPRYRFAIQGLPAELRRTVLRRKAISTMPDESKTSHWQARHSGSLAPRTGKYLGDNPYNPKNDPAHFALWREAYVKAQNQIDRFKHEDGGYRSL